MNIPDGVTYIGNFTFSGCSSLSDIFIPASVSEIGYNVFDGCDNLNVHVKFGSYAHMYAEENGMNVFF